MAPPELLHVAKRLEAEAGRTAGERWGPRPLDVDLLFVGARVERSPELELPHPRLRERAFVLAPLAALRPDLALPPDGCLATELLAALPDGQRCDRVPWT